MHKRITLILFLMVALCSPAFGAKGVIVYKKSGCDYFIVETNRGFALLEWYGGYDPDTGDVLVGNYESYGFKDIYDATADRELRVYVDDYLLSKDSVIEKYNDKCD